MLCVIDSIGLRDEVQGNRFKKANTPTFDEFLKVIQIQLFKFLDSLLVFQKVKWKNQK